MCFLFHLSWDVVLRHPMKNCTLRRRSCPDLFLASLHCSNVKGGVGDNQGQDNQSGSLPSGGKSHGVFYTVPLEKVVVFFFLSTCLHFCALHGQHSLISTLRPWKNDCWRNPWNSYFPGLGRLLTQRCEQEGWPDFCQGWLTAPTACADTDLQMKQFFCYLWGVCGGKPTIYPLGRHASWILNMQ